jgi:integrase
MVNQMTAEQTLDKIREQNRIRSRRYYENNQAKIATKRKIAREECKECKEDAKKCEDCKPEEKPKKKDNSKTVLTQQESVSQLKDIIEKDSSKTTYENNVKALTRILNCSDFNKCLKNAKSVIYKIETAKQVKDPTKLYSINSKKGIYQAILFMIDNLGIKVSKNAKDQYNTRFDITKTTSYDQTKERVATEEVMDYDVYEQKVKVFFGEGSKESLIVSLYKLSGFRDNLVIELVQSIPKDMDKNYIVVPSSKTQNLKFVLNTYKTDKKYSQDIIPIPKELSKEIRKYIDHHDVQYGEYLFGKTKLSGFISKFNKKMDLPVKVSINKLRQMRVSKVFENNPSVEERVKLAKEMKHSTTTSEKYKRKIMKNIEV